MYQINFTLFPQIEIANWVHLQHSQTLNLQSHFNGLMTHIWGAKVLSMDKWNVLEPLEGTFVTLITTNHEDRNNPTLRTYLNARVHRVSGEHVALHMADVEVEFKV